MDNSWVTWIIQGIIMLGIAVLGYFIKRTLDQNEERDKAQNVRMDKLEEKLNNFINNLPFQYTLRDDFIRAVAGFDSKLDKILDKINGK